MQASANSSVRPAGSSDSSTRGDSTQRFAPSSLAGADALGERESLQLKIDNGVRLSPVEQGTYERLSALAQLRPGQPDEAQIHLAQQQIETSDRSDRACAATSSLTSDLLGLFVTEPKTIDDFNIRNATPQDIADLGEALSYLQGTDQSGNWKSETAVDLLASLPDCTTIGMNSYRVTRVDRANGSIDWDARAGLIVEKGHQSAALGLAHEIDHLVNYEEPSRTYYDDYADTEEQRVITGSETQIANDLGEPTRDSHDGIPYHFESSTKSSIFE